MPLITCLDLEGVLVPEVWIAFAEKTGIEELRRTTRDEPDYDVLMRGRLEILDANGFKLAGIQDVIGTLAPLEGAVEFLDEIPRTSTGKFQKTALRERFKDYKLS